MKTYDELSKKNKNFVDTLFTNENFPKLNNDPRLWIYLVEHGQVQRREQVAAPASVRGDGE